METTETIPEPRRLTRPREGRWLGGVCAGLGEYFELSPTIYRIAFVALALAGGTGILLYIASWLVMPEEASGESIAAAALKEHRDRPARVIGLAVLAFAAIILLSEAHVWPSPGNLWLAAALAGGALVWWQVSRQPAADATAPVRLRNLFPLALSLLLVIAGVVTLLDVAAVWNADWRIVLGAMAILLGALVSGGAATGRSVGAVAALGLVVLAVLAVALAVRVPVFAGVGDRVVHRVAPSSLRSKYEDGARRVGSRRGHRSGARAAHAGSSPRRSGRTGAAGAGARVSLPLRRVVLVDDHDLFRAGVRGGLGASVEVVGEAGSVADAVPLIKALDPDVVLLDVHLPDGGGQAVIMQVAPERPAIRFLALSVSDAVEDVIGVIRAGARGYVTKAISGDELTAAVHRTADGDAVFSPRLAGFVLDAFRSGEAAADPELDQLTAREREVLQLIARGYRYKEIAARLHLSARTVESHVSAVVRKLQLSSRHELTRWAAARRLI